MSVTLRNTLRPSALGGLFMLTSMGLVLGACSGTDEGDEAVGEGRASVPAASDGAGEEDERTAVPARGGDADDVDEDGSDAERLDPSTVPSTSGNVTGDAADSGEPAVPDTELCATVEDWDPEWVQFEEDVLALVNDFRSAPADCGVEGQFAAAAPLTMNPILRCSARLHSIDMFERDYFDHNTPDGIDPFERMAEAGFVGSGGGENIALGQSTPEEVMEAWMDSDGHCANIMRAEFDTIGVGYHPGAGGRGLGSNYWTQNFGAPPFMRSGRR